METKPLLPLKMLFLGIFAMLCCQIFIGCERKAPEQDAPFTYNADSLAAHDPDQYVWIKFCEFFAYTDASKLIVQWENWINEDSIYMPKCDVPRNWPSEPPLHRFRQAKSTTILEGLKSAQGVFDTTLFAILTLNKTPYLEEVRINKPMFDYIVDNKLYLKSKVLEMARKGTIDFPKESAILKSQWKTISESEKSKYFWDVYVDESGNKNLIGMAAFHLVTHQLPHYVWSTFEHVDNPGRCDFIGCHDSFGFSPANVDPHRIDSLVYDADSIMSPELASLFERFKIGDVFNNYRLKAAQIDYTDAKGETTLNGSSVLEANLVSTSSCISCHARATVNNITGKPLSMFVDPHIVGDGTFETGDKINTSRGWHPVCFTGPPIDSDYTPVSQSGLDSTFYMVNFMWQLAQDAGSCDGTENGAGNMSSTEE